VIGSYIPQLLFKSSTQMSELGDGMVSLILTGPPYFPDELEERLRRGRLRDHEINVLEGQIREFAFELKTTFSEMVRVLAPHGVIVMQTRDVRLSDRLISVEQIHRMLLEAMGLVFYTRYLWRPSHTSKNRLTQLESEARSGHPRAFDPEVFQVYKRPGAVTHGSPTDEDIDLLTQDIISTPLGRLHSPHRFQAPIPILISVIRCWSNPEDVVLDPFMGGGTTIWAARSLSRKAIGYECVKESFRLAQCNLGLVD